MKTLHPKNIKNWKIYEVRKFESNFTVNIMKLFNINNYKDFTVSDHYQATQFYFYN